MQPVVIQADMDIPRDQWVARCASAICSASRWVSGASLVLSALALCYLYLLPTGHPLAAAVISLATVAGAAQVYLAVRIEFDRMIFENFAGAAAGAVEAAGGFDRAAQALGLLSGGNTGRDLAQRTAGALLLVKIVFSVFLLQLGLLIVAAWIPG